MKQDPGSSSKGIFKYTHSTGEEGRKRSASTLTTWRHLRACSRQNVSLLPRYFSVRNLVVKRKYVVRTSVCLAVLFAVYTIAPSVVAVSLVFDYSFVLAKYPKLDIPRDPRIPGISDIRLQKFPQNQTFRNQSPIFFLETDDTGSIWRGRQLCAFESAARMNPTRTIQVLKTSDVMTPTKALTALLEKFPQQIRFFYFTTEEVLEESPMLSWHKSSKWREAEPHVLLRHQADAVRLSLIYKYGGTYLDTDIISLRGFHHLPPNLIGQEPADFFRLSNAVLVNFEAKHLFLKEAMDRGVADYDPFKWGSIGPDLLTKVVLESSKYFESQGFTINVAPYHYFHPFRAYTSHVGRPSTAQFFHSSRLNAREMLEYRQFSYTIHLLGSITSHYKVDRESEQPITVMAREKCPIALKEAEFF